MARAERLGEKARGRLERMKKKHELIDNVCGLGLMLGVELVKDRETKERAYELGLIVAFLQGNVLRIQPPLTIEEELLEEGLDRLEEAIEDVENGDVQKKL